MNRKPSGKHQLSLNTNRNIVDRKWKKDPFKEYREAYSNDTRELEKEFDKRYYHNDE